MTTSGTVHKRPVIQLTHALLVIALLVAVIHASVATAASLVNAGRIGGRSTDVVNSVARDPTGAVYMTGYFGGTADFDPGPGTVSLSPGGNFDAFVVKLDPSGALVWARSLGGALGDQGVALAADASGVYVTGTFEGAADLDPGTGTSTVTSQGGTDVFLLKLDGNGNFVWGRAFGGTVNDSSSALALAGGALYLVGDYRSTVDLDPGPGVATFSSANGSSDIFISKFDLTGSLVWARTLRGAQDEVSRGIASDGTGVYVTGAFFGSVDFDPGPGTTSLSATADSADTFVLRLDTAGNFVWVRSVGGPANELPVGIAVDGSGVYVAGQFDGTADFDPGAGTTTATPVGSFDVFLLKLSTGGDFGWVSTFGGAGNDTPFGLAVNASGVYVTGGFAGTVDFDPGSGGFSLTSAGGLDAFVVRLTSSGGFVTAYRFGGSRTDVGASLALDGSTIYLAGTFEGTVDFDPGTGTANLTSAGANDIFLSIATADPDQPVAVADAYTVAAGTMLTVPARGVLANDTHPAGSSISLQAVLETPPGRGRLDLRADGSFTYAPGAGTAGTDQFTYRATSGTTASNPATVTVTINQTQCAPRPPVRLTTTSSGGQLQVTISVSPLGTGAANKIQELQFLATRSNAQITINGATLPPTGQVNVPINGPSAVFTVRRSSQGSPAGTTVPLLVIDGCGSWPTLVGGGSQAF